MSRIAYVNGRYVPHRDAVVHVEDRGYQFADGVYEVCQALGGSLIDLAPHLDRLERSLAALRIAMPVSRKALELVVSEVLWRNLVRDGIIYIQVTRGMARRDHVFPAASRPALVVTARAIDMRRFDALAQKGVGVVAMDDLRWKRVDIKTINLTANVLARQTAREQGYFEAWLVDDKGFVTEGAATNAWIVTGDGVVVTRPAGPEILAGVTRETVLRQLAANGVRVELRPFTIAEAQGAREAFITGATLTVMPVVFINDQPVGNGQPGEAALGLRENFQNFTQKA